jgi:hypothetical protein
MGNYHEDGCVVLLAEGKKWEDLDIEEALTKSGCNFAMSLSPDIQLYLISDFYCVKANIKTAIKNNVIAKACIFDSYMCDEYTYYTGVNKNDLGLFSYSHDYNYGDWQTDPYVRTTMPEIPIKAHQFAPDTMNDIPYFNEISFENETFIQPMESFSCNTYLSLDESENEYAKVISSDCQEVYCLLSQSEQIRSLIELDNCRKCHTSSNRTQYGLWAYQDNPPVIIIETCRQYRHKKWDQYKLLLKNIYKGLNIRKKECCKTFCVKCSSNQKDAEKDFTFPHLPEKFQNCHEKLSVEISFLHPALLIAIDENVVELLKTQYEITGFSAAPCMCNIVINGHQYPLLVLNNANSEEELATLASYLSGKSDEIQTILAQPRNLPPPKPRVILIDEND